MERLLNVEEELEDMTYQASRVVKDIYHYIPRSYRFLARVPACSSDAVRLLSYWGSVWRKVSKSQSYREPFVWQGQPIVSFAVPPVRGPEAWYGWTRIVPCRWVVRIIADLQ